MSVPDMKMTGVTTEAVTLHVEQEGTGAPALVFLHYWGRSARTWTAVMGRLSSTNRCVTIDQRGWGRSEAPANDYAIRDLADDAQAVISALRLTDYILVGQSMGGEVAQLVASRRPDGLRGVVLVAPAPAKPPVIPEAVRGQMADAYGSRDSVIAALDTVLRHATLGRSFASRSSRTASPAPNRPSVVGSRTPSSRTSPPIWTGSTSPCSSWLANTTGSTRSS